jgi:hypothetical protein
MSDFLILFLCFALVFASTWFGIHRGRRVSKDTKPDHQHLGTIQGALLGLLGLLLSFAFSGSMSRFIERQSALAREANAIGSAYDRVALLPNAARVQAIIRDYTALRINLFHNDNTPNAASISQQLDDTYTRLYAETLQGIHQSPQFASLAIVGVEAIDNELSTRNALARRHLPLEFVAVMLAASCIAMGTVGYAVGMAEKRSIGTIMALAALVSTTLFVTFDFDRPSRGLVRLDPTPLTQLADRLKAPPPTPPPAPSTSSPTP